MPFPLKEFSGTRNNTSGTEVSATVPAGGIPVGHHLLLSFAAAGNTQLSSLADSRGNTYQVDRAGETGTGFRAAIASTKITTALLEGDTITATQTAASNFAILHVAEADDLAETGWFDKDAVGSGSGGNTIETGLSDATTQADERLYGAGSVDASQVINWTAGDFGVSSGSATLLTKTEIGGNRQLQPAYRDVSATGQYKANFTHDDDSAAAWGAALATYKLAAAGPVDLMPDPVAIPLSIPAPAVALSYVLTPDAVAIPIAVPTPSVTQVLTIAPEPVVVPIVIPEPTVTGGGPAAISLTPGPVSISLSVPSPSVTLAYALAPDPVTIGVAVPEPTVNLTTAITLTPDPVVIALAIPTPTVTGVADGPDIRINWDGSGFERLPITHDITMEYTRGAGVNLEGQTPSSATFVLHNDDERYTDTNPLSDLAGRMNVNARVWSTYIHEGTRYPWWSGYLDDIAVMTQTFSAELVADDLLARLAEIDVNVVPVNGMTYGEYRQAILEAAGVPVAEMDLDIEADVMAHTADYGSGKALALLDQINEATGSRHFVRFGTTEATWQQYVSANRHHKLSQTAVDVSLDDLDFERSSFGGWRAAWKTVINRQAVGVTLPPSFADEATEVWVSPLLPLSVPASTTRVVWASQIGATADAVLVIAGTNIASSDMTVFADAAKIEITAGGSAATVTALSITARAATSGGAAQVVADDAGSQAEFGTHDGPGRSAIATTPTTAEGLAEHLVWRYHEPRKQPSMVQPRQDQLPLMLGRDLFDIAGFTADELSVTDRRMEIVGDSGSIERGVVRMRWQLQDTPEQSPLTEWAIVGVSEVGDSSVTGY